MSEHKSPIFATVLNFLFLGAGYLYLGKRRTFGWIMLLATVVMTLEYFFGNLSHLNNLVDTHTFSFLLIAIATAVDGYLLGREK